MKPPTMEELEGLVAQGRFEQAIALLERLDPPAAANLVMAIPFSEQQKLFRVLPVELAATLVGEFPYYHAYVLLHLRPVRELRAIVDKMNPDDRLQFFDELPGEAWQTLTEELSGKGVAEARREGEMVAAVEVPPAIEKAPPAAEPIIEAFEIEKSYLQPDGRHIPVIAASARPYLCRDPCLRRLHQQIDDPAPNSSLRRRRHGGRRRRLIRCCLILARAASAELLELLSDRGGREDLYHVAEELLMKVGDLQPIVEGATLLGFARTEKGDVELTPSGRAFVDADIAASKPLFREAALAHTALIQRIQSSLHNKSDHAMPAEFFRDVLDEHFAEDEVQRQIETALNWGRCGEIFTYDSATDRLLSHQAVGSADSTEHVPHH